MWEFLTRYMLKMWQVVVASLAAGLAGQIFFEQRWLGFWLVAVPLMAIYFYQQYAVIDNEKKRLERKKHANKYR